MTPPPTIYTACSFENEHGVVVERMALHPIDSRPTTDASKPVWKFRVVFRYVEGLDYSIDKGWRFSCMGQDSAGIAGCIIGTSSVWGLDTQAIEWLLKGEDT